MATRADLGGLDLTTNESGRSRGQDVVLSIVAVDAWLTLGNIIRPSCYVGVVCVSACHIPM
jgi:hypothetical protein